MHDERITDEVPALGEMRGCKRIHEVRSHDESLVEFPKPTLDDYRIHR